MIVPVILAGGSGSRLWPLSRGAYPKQLLPLASQLTLLQETALRVRSIIGIASPIVICNQEHRFLVAEQLQAIGIMDATILLEPEGRNTAPAVAIAALYLSEIHANDPVLLVLPADHVIEDLTLFTAAVRDAEKNAQTGSLVTFGIQPTRAETGYGYIKSTTAVNAQQGYPILQFIEKPDQATADAYVASGQYYWNSGMFMFQGSSYLAELTKYAPDIFQACRRVALSMTKDLDFLRLDAQTFAECPNQSIDYAVMEKTDNAVLVPLAAGWSDLGSWTALYDLMEKNQDGNAIKGDVIAYKSSHSYLQADNRLLVAIGLDNHIVVETADAVLVANKDNCQEIKEIVLTLKGQQRSEANLHRKVYRPWGFYETIDSSTAFLVKRITVKPGGSLSLQVHQHRSEHWVVVSGIAEVTCGEKVFSLNANESTYIPKMVKHKLVNHHDKNLEIIEVQSGSYLGEDDIVRFSDNYGRVEEINSSQKIQSS